MPAREVKQVDIRCQFPACKATGAIDMAIITHVDAIRQHITELNSGHKGGVMVLSEDLSRFQAFLNYRINNIIMFESQILSDLPSPNIYLVRLIFQGR